MDYSHLVSKLVCAAAAVALAGCTALHQRTSGPTFGTTPQAPVYPCEALASYALPPTTPGGGSATVLVIDSTTPTAATDALPEHCIVRGRVNPRVGVNNTPFAISFELRLPSVWNGRFFFQGGGGNDGVVLPATGNPRNGGPVALARGFAVVSTDGGHSSPSAASYGFDPQARIDHAYNAYDKTVVVAKGLIGHYYGKQPDRSYILGCSGGGRQGMMFAQRFPSYFDGIVAIAPAMRVATGASTSAAWETIAYAAIAPLDATGKPILSRAFSDEDLTLLSRGILQACDALDGIADGMVTIFKPAASIRQCCAARQARVTAA